MTKQVHLSDGERLILAMLCDIYEHLGIKPGFQPDLIRESLFGGNFWGLQWAYSGVLEAKPKDTEIVDEVCDILDMYYLLETAVEELSDEDKERIKAESPFGCRFEGFDGNNETDHWSVARFLVDQLGRFEHFEDRGDLNSHCPSLDAYRRMLEVYKPNRTQILKRPIRPEGIIEVLKARIHPDNREKEGRTPTS